MLNFTNEQLEAAKTAQSPEALIAMAKDAGVELTPEQAERFLSPPIGEITEEELENVTGGGCGAKKTWREKAAVEGYIYYLNLPCPTCKAAKSGEFSLYSTYHDWLTMVDGHLQKRYQNIKCFNCTAKFDQSCDGVFSNYG